MGVKASGVFDLGGCWKPSAPTPSPLGPFCPQRLPKLLGVFHFEGKRSFMGPPQVGGGGLGNVVTTQVGGQVQSLVAVIMGPVGGFDPQQAQSGAYCGVEVGLPQRGMKE